MRGLDLVALPAAGQCCGIGGAVAIKNAGASMARLSDKVRCVPGTRFEFADCSFARHAAVFQPTAGDFSSQKG